MGHSDIVSPILVPLEKVASFILGQFVILHATHGYETYFYTPDVGDNRNRLYSGYSSFTVFKFTFFLKSTYNICIHDIDAYAYHRQYDKWLLLDDRMGSVPPNRSLGEYVLNFQNAPKSAMPYNLDKDVSSKLVVRKIGEFPTSFEAMSGDFAYVLLILKINTSYVIVVCQVTGMSPYVRAGGILSPGTLIYNHYDEQEFFAHAIGYISNLSEIPVKQKVSYWRRIH